MVPWLIDCSNGPLIDWLFEWSLDWLIVRMVPWLIDCSNGPLVDWLFEWSLDWLNGRLIDWLIDFRLGYCYWPIWSGCIVFPCRSYLACCGSRNAHAISSHRTSGRRTVRLRRRRSRWRVVACHSIVPVLPMRIIRTRRRLSCLPLPTEKAQIRDELVSFFHLKIKTALLHCDVWGGGGGQNKKLFYRFTPPFSLLLLLPCHTALVHSFFVLLRLLFLLVTLFFSRKTDTPTPTHTHTLCLGKLVLHAATLSNCIQPLSTCIQPFLTVSNLFVPCAANPSFRHLFSRPKHCSIIYYFLRMWGVFFWFLICVVAINGIVWVRWYVHVCAGGVFFLHFSFNLIAIVVVILFPSEGACRVFVHRKVIRNSKQTKRHGKSRADYVPCSVKEIYEKKWTMLWKRVPS